MIRPLRLHNRQRCLQGKVQDGLRRQLDLLALGRRLYAPTQTSAGGCADRSSLASAGNRTDDGSDSGACPDLRGRVFAPRRTLTPILIGLQTVVFASSRNAVQLQSHHGLTRELPGALHLYQMTFNVVAWGDRHLTVHGQRRIQRGTEGLALLAGFGIDAIDQPYRQSCPRWNRNFPRRRWRGRSGRYRGYRRSRRHGGYGSWSAIVVRRRRRIAHARLAPTRLRRRRGLGSLHRGWGR